MRKVNMKQKLKKDFKYPKTFKDVKVIRDELVNTIHELTNAPVRTPDISERLKDLKSELSILDSKIEGLELLYSTLTDIYDDNPSLKVNPDLSMTDLITGIISGEGFNYLRLIPFKHDVQYLNALYYLLFYTKGLKPNGEYILNYELEFLYNLLNKFRIDNRTAHDKSVIKILHSEITKIIIIFAEFIDIDDAVKLFDFSSEDLFDIINTYSKLEDGVDWYGYFIGRYYAEMRETDLFDIVAIRRYLEDEASFSEREEFTKGLLKFIEKLDKDKEISVDEYRLETNIDYVIETLEEIMKIIEDDRLI